MNIILENQISYSMYVYIQYILCVQYIISEAVARSNKSLTKKQKILSSSLYMYSSSLLSYFYHLNYYISSELQTGKSIQSQSQNK